MSSEYSFVDVADVEPEISSKSRTEHVDLAARLGCTDMRPKIWTLEPGNTRKNYHRHAEQEEVYVVLRGPGRIRVADDRLTVPEWGAVRVPPETPRKLFNDTEEEHVWLVIGAPNVDGPTEVLDE